MSVNHEMLNTLYKLKKEILKSDNRTLVSQIDHAILKTYNDQYVISFIGHYSAGKSSLINHLLNTDILPSSPVPTTSNTVAVQIGDRKEIRAFLNQYEYVSLDNYDELRDLNTKDLDIAAINMDVRHDDFKNNTVFQDTPGVDSGTGSHEESANRFLLNSDYIFFTVEYNHVESEHNLKLLKEISNLGIKLSLIINQVDKHDDDELSMGTFLERIKNTLKDWDVNVEDIYTTSIYTSPYNQMDALKTSIHSLEHTLKAQDVYFDRIIKNIEDKQLEYLSGSLDAIREEIGTGNGFTIEGTRSRLQFLQNEIEKSKIDLIHQDEAALQTHVNDSVRKIVKDSYIFPHQVKSAITEYLKLLAGEVKIPGLFGRKKKEKALYDEMQQNIDEAFEPVIETEVNAPVNSFFKSINLTGKPFKYHFDNMILIDERITSLSNRFIQNYLDKLKQTLTKDVTAAAVLHLGHLNRSEIGEVRKEESLTEEQNAYTRVLELLTLIDSIRTENYRHFYIHMDDEIDRLNLTREVEIDMDDQEARPQTAADNTFKAEAGERLDLEPFYKITDILNNHPRYAEFSHIISEKLSRIENGKANISVFGGFSAGKTTFINALMGEHKLNTSPNPTTATITEINDAKCSVVTYKDEHDLIDTLETLSNETHGHVTGYMKWIRRNIDNVPETYKPFLNGIINLYSDYAPYLGQKVEIDTDTLINMVSNDEDATFLHKANVALQNDITGEYNLVDSPGINSTNRRHTKETRNIIADSDLIIYVSYYNHVFSKSDESFLKYIRSIKGRDFPLIFVINAVDLMRNEADKEKVIDYMSNSLIGLEINHVVYPVSSKNALSHGDENFEDAKSHIVSIADEHAGIIQYKTLVETYGQLQYRIRSNIRQFENRESERGRLIQNRRELMQDISGISAFLIEDRLKQEIDVVISFITKRFELKLYDHLKGLITASDAKDKNYLTRNEALITHHINEFLTLEVGTVFNAIYRYADEELQNMVTELNERLRNALTVHLLDIGKVDGREPILAIDSSMFKEVSKSLYRTRHNTREFRDELLAFATSLIQTIDMDSMQREMEHLINEALTDVDSTLQTETDIIYEELNSEIPEIKESDYRKDIDLEHELSQLEGAADISHQL